MENVCSGWLIARPGLVVALVALLYSSQSPAAVNSTGPFLKSPPALTVPDRQTLADNPPPCTRPADPRQQPECLAGTRSFLSGLFSPGSGINPWLLIGGAGAGLGAMAAASGGGGGRSGGDDGGADRPEDSPADSPAPPAEPDSFGEGAPAGTEPTDAAYYETGEYLQRADLELIQAKEAYANIARLMVDGQNPASAASQGGAGITIAILDTGIDTDHDDLDSNIRTDCLSSFSCKQHYGAFDSDGHGSHVAGIAAGQKNGQGMHGVAYNASLLPGCANIGGGCAYNAVSDAELMLWAADHGATVANMSYAYVTGFRALVASDIAAGINPYADPELKKYLFGTYNSLYTSQYQQARRALEQGLVTVVAAGNFRFFSAESQQPGIMTLAPLIYGDTDLADDLALQWLAAVNLQGDGRLASSSHACGDAAPFCLAAPGTLITSTVPDNRYDEMTGTSMAAPQITGAIALVAGAFPTLELPKDNPYAAFCDSGSDRYNRRQCHSKAVVNRLLVTATDLGEPGTDPLYGRGLLNLDRATRLIGEPVLVSATGERYSIDDNWFNGAAPVNGDIAGQLARLRFIAVDDYDQAGFLVSGARLAGPAPVLGGFSLSYLNRSLEPERITVTAPGTGLSFAYRRSMTGADTGQYQFSYALTPSARLTMGYGLKDGLKAWADTGLTVIGQALDDPLTGFSDKAHSLSYQQTLARGYTLSAGFWQGQVAQRQSQRLRSQRLDVRLAATLGQRLRGQLVLAGLREQTSLLGGQGAGIWSTGRGSQSLMAGIALDYQLSAGLDMRLGYYRVRTATRSLPGRFTVPGGLWGDSFSAGLLARNDRWHYGFFVSQPLRVNRGRLQMLLPTGYQGRQLSYSSAEIDLVPQGRHLEYELAIGWQATTLPLSARLNLVRVQDYGNRQGNDDHLVLLGLGLRF